MIGQKFRGKLKKFDWEGMRIPLILIVIVLFAMFLRIYWAVGPSIQYGYSVSGGSDSYYHEKIIFHILDSKHQLLNDPMLNYPMGVNNPRPPLFHWSIVLSSYILAPFMDMRHAAVLMLILFPAIFGSLTVIPVYLLGKEAFNRRVGILAAILLAIMPADITRSVATQADWDAFNLFFIILSFYFFLRALKTVNYKHWIKNWFNLKEVKGGLINYIRENKVSMVYAALSGVSLGAVALAWKGYTYAIAILVIYLLFQVFMNRFRNKSNLHIVAISLIYTIFAFGTAFPWYYVTHRLIQWYAVPLILMLGVLFVGIILEVTGKYPWTFVFLLAAIVIGAALAIINVFIPDLWELIVSGQGYFVKSKLYSTIAEAQPATLGYLVMSFGVAIFFFAIIGIFDILYLIKKKKEDYYFFFVFYTIIAVYMAISAARFIFNASPAFALTGAIGVIWLIKIVKLRETFEEIKKYRGNWKKTLKTSLKISQITVILIIIFLLVIPTVWSAVDAGIPYEAKKKYDRQIYNSLPFFMRPNETAYNSSSPWYLGAFGYSLPKSGYPWPRAWKWLSEQDNYSPPEDRPAFVSWWDYGFESVKEGKHPAVADNFQNGYQMAAQIITAQNESEVISLFIIRLMEGDYNHHNGLSNELKNILHKYFSDDEVKKIEDIFKEPSKYRSLILQRPDYYGYYTDDISDKNTMYVALKGLLAHQSELKLIKLYDDVRNYTHKDIRYFAVDYRLFPFSGRNTGIFYAPAKLGDRRIYQYGGTVIPYDFYTLKAVDEYGNEYNIDKIPANVHIVNYKIEYKPMFYHCMLYRTFIGYSGKDIGKGEGIPGLSSGLYNYYPMQAWNLTHFKLVYRTAYWNPYKDYKNHTKDWKPIPIELALKYQKEKKGIVELNPPAYQVLPNDVVMVKFYEGAIIEGTIKLTTGEPLKHVRVTLFDEFGIPHTSVFTDDQGHYKLYAVAGNLTLVASTNGNLSKLNMLEKTVLHQWKVNVTEEQAMRLKPNYIIKKDIEIKPSTLDGEVYFDVNHNKKLDDEDSKVQKGIIELVNSTYHYNESAMISNGYYIIHNVPPHTYGINLIINGQRFKKVATVSMSAGNNFTKDIRLLPSYVIGNVTYPTGKPAANATVELRGNHAYYTGITDENGSFRILVVPDNYTMVVSKGSYYSDKINVPANLWNYTTSENVTLHHAFEIKGVVKYGGQILPHAIIKITSELTFHTVTLINTGDKGEFSVDLPGGIYSIYGLWFNGNEKAVYFNLINLNKNISLNVNLEKAYRFAGYINVSRNVSNIEITAFEGDKFYRGFANFTGYFEIYLPKGRYSIGFIGFDNKNRPYFNRVIIDLRRDVYTSVILHSAYNITGYVYAGEKRITDGLLFLSDDKGNYEVRNIPPVGKFKLATNINYQIHTMVWGYSQINVRENNTGIIVNVQTDKVLLKGNLIRNEMVNNLPVNVMFQAMNGSYNITLRNVISSYSTYLPPGNYTIFLFGYNRTYSLQESHFYVPLGYSILTKNISFIAKAHVVVVTHASSVTWFQNGFNKTTGKIVNLTVGSYVIYGKNSTYATIKKVNITQNCTIELKIQKGYIVNLNVENYSENIQMIRILSEYGNISIRKYSVILPEGSYNFTISKIRFENGMYYDYYGYNNTYIDKDIAVNITIKPMKILSHVVGNVVENGKYISNCRLEFIAQERGKMNVSVVTDSVGHFDLYITPGKYLLYTLFVDGGIKYANFSLLSIMNSTENVLVVLNKAYSVSGGVYLNNEPINLVITVSSNGDKMDIYAYGYYNVILPKGNYTIYAQTERYEYSKNILYSFSSSFNLTCDKYVDIKLNRQSIHRIDVKPFSYDRTVSPNTTMDAILKVKNTGNSVEKIKFEGLNGWVVTDKENTIIYPDETRYVLVHIRAPNNAKYGEDQIHLRVFYSGENSDVYLTVNVTAVHSTTVSSTLSGWVNNSLLYKLKVENNGNRWMNYTISVINAQSLHAKGWSVEISVAGHQQSWINVSSFASGFVEVSIHAIRDNPSTVEPLMLGIYGEKEYLLKLKLLHPQISTASLYVTGSNVHNYTGVEIPVYYYILWIVAVAMIVALIIGGRRK